MSDFTLSPELAEKIQHFTMPDTLGFGVVKSPVMFRADYRDGQWDEGQLVPYAPIELDPAAKVLHYAQTVFEGLKAYQVDQDAPNLFRPLKNLQRLNLSSRRICMPDLPESVFMRGVSQVTRASQPLIPNETGHSLYLRPLVIGTQAALGMAVSDSYIFLVMASPSQPYHAGHMRVLIEREACRAARGGTGAAKTGGNYAAALYSARQTQAKGYHQSLWLDPESMEYIEELSGMNFFAVIDGELHTPSLTPTFLAGITRDSVIELARSQGVQVVERSISINELLRDIQAGRCTEVFACGTAAIVSPVSVLAEADGVEYELPQVDVLASELRSKLLDIQERRAADPFGWVTVLG